jgi:predicted RNase H-like HicB family nuclease
MKVKTVRKPPKKQGLRFSIQTEIESDGRWIAEIPEIPGAMAYGAAEHEAIVKSYAIALRSVADNVERSQQEPPTSISVTRVIA